MKYLFSMLVISIVCSCTSKQVKKEPFPFLEVTQKEWATYEGKIVTDEGLETEIELSLKENTVGIDSYYKLQGVYSSDSEVRIDHSQGKFGVTYGLPDNAMGVTLHGKVTGRLTTSTVFVPQFFSGGRGGKKIMRGNLEEQDIYFTTQGDEQLVLSDDDFDPVEDAKYILYKRSELFTAEGYLTVEDDGDVEFFERNTSENWKVARLGVYTELEANYRKLATIPMEGIYLRALAYSVADTSALGEPIRKLVVKRVVEMNASH